MEKDLVGGKIGEVGAYDVEFKGGKLLAKASLGKEFADLGVKVASEVSVELSASAIFAAIKKAIPGQYDDLVLDGLLKLLES